MVKEMTSRGGPLAEQDDVVAFLLHSHGVTRALLHVAKRLVGEHGTEQEIVSVADAMQRFFTFWNPLHEVDEEQTVAPAVSAFAPPDVAVAVVARLVLEHQALDDVRDQCARPWIALAASPGHFARLRDELGASTRRLTEALARHTSAEERAFFPLVRRYVPADEQRAMLAVMRTRRRGVVESLGEGVRSPVGRDRSVG